eukprot:tig00001000_g6185.t1
MRRGFRGRGRGQGVVNVDAQANSAPRSSHRGSDHEVETPADESVECLVREYEYVACGKLDKSNIRDLSARKPEEAIRFLQKVIQLAKRQEHIRNPNGFFSTISAGHSWSSNSDKFQEEGRVWVQVANVGVWLAPDVVELVYALGSAMSFGLSPRTWQRLQHEDQDDVLAALRQVQQEQPPSGQLDEFILDRLQHAAFPPLGGARVQAPLKHVHGGPERRLQQQQLLQQQQQQQQHDPVASAVQHPAQRGAAGAAAAEQAAGYAKGEDEAAVVDGEEPVPAGAHPGAAAGPPRTVVETASPPDAPWPHAPPGFPAKRSAPPDPVPQRAVQSEAPAPDTPTQLLSAEPAPCAPAAATFVSQPSAPAPQPAAPDPQLAAPAPQQSAPAPQQPAPAPQQPAPDTQLASPAPQQPAPAPEHPAPASQQPAMALEQPAPALEQPSMARQAPAPAPQQPAPASTHLVPQPHSVWKKGAPRPAGPTMPYAPPIGLREALEQAKSDNARLQEEVQTLQEELQKQRRDVEEAKRVFAKAAPLRGQLQALESQLDVERAARAAVEAEAAGLRGAVSSNVDGERRLRERAEKAEKLVQQLKAGREADRDRIRALEAELKQLRGQQDPEAAPSAHDPAREFEVPVVPVLYARGDKTTVPENVLERLTPEWAGVADAPGAARFCLRRALPADVETIRPRVAIVLGHAASDRIDRQEKAAVDEARAKGAMNVVLVIFRMSSDPSKVPRAADASIDSGVGDKKGIVRLVQYQSQLVEHEENRAGVRALLEMLEAAHA